MDIEDVAGDTGEIAAREGYGSVGRAGFSLKIDVSLELRPARSQIRDQHEHPPSRSLRINGHPALGTPRTTMNDDG